WSIFAQPPGSAAQIGNPGAQFPTFTPDKPGAYDFRLTLTDQLGLTSTSFLSVDTAAAHPGVVGACGTHAPALVAKVIGPVGSASTGAPNEPVAIRTQLDATGSASPDDFHVSPYPAGCGLTRDLSYQWALTTAPTGSTTSIDSPSLIDPSFVPDQPGTYTVQVTASDGRNSASTTLAVNAVGGFATTPATTGTVLTSTATDSSGNPVVAFWDNTSGSVSAVQCTSG